MATVSSGYTFVNNDTVTPAKLNSLAGGASVTNIQTSDISDSQITTAKIADSNVTTAKIADSNVTTAKIADSNVTTAKIADSNVTTAKIADSAITSAKIADSNVTTAKIADSAITSAKIADGAIVATDIANNAVTAAKLGTNEQKQIAKAWVNFNGASAGNPDYPTGNTVTYAAGSSTTLVTVTRSAHSIAVNDWITVSGVTGATAVMGTFQVTAVTGTTFQYIVNSVVSGTVGGTAVVRVTTIRSQYNVSSITKNGTGDYTVNFATAMTDTNYSYVGSSRFNADSFSGYTPSLYSWLSDSKTTSSVRVRSNTSNQTVQDSSEVNLVVFGN